MIAKKSVSAIWFGFCLSFGLGLSLLTPAFGESDVWQNPDKTPDTITDTEQKESATRDQYQEDIAAAETYMSSLITMQADFVQIAPNRTTSFGILSLEKPGHLRFEYTPPSPLLIVSDGKVLTLVDRELKQVTRWPVKDTPLGPLVRSGTVFDDDVDILDVTRHGEQLRVTISKAGKGEDGTMELVFSRSPMKLLGWEIIDGQGSRTIIALSDLVTGLALDRELWTFDDPRPNRRRRPGGR